MTFRLGRSRAGTSGHRTHRLNGLAKAAPVLVAATAATLFAATPPVSASSHEQINGSGSSWAYNAIAHWVSDTAHSFQVVFTPTGSATGRTDYANGVTDFAVSDIGYQGQNPVTGGNDSSNRAYAYLPIVGGATAFPYNIVVAGRRVQNLRLSGQTLAKIFTNQITNWDDPAVTADNNGRQFPSIPIIPVIHSEGAGSTFQFTDWLYTEYPSFWQGFTGYKFPTEFWPTGKGSQVAENGSDGVMNFVASGAGAGSIGYDEYSYALGADFPVIAVENTAGWYTMPDAYDAAVALTQAQINYTPGPNYLLETLNSVYSYNDPRTYPLSSYSYEILPTAASCSGSVPQCDPTMNTPKRQTLADFDTYSLCPGQAEMAPIGYSPLPVNLVEASFKQVGLLHNADPGVDVTAVNVAACNNPTFIPGQPNGNYLAQIAPFPPACAQSGQGPCVGQYAHNGNPIAGHAAPITSTGGGTSPTGSAARGASGSGGASAGGSSGSVPSASGAANAASAGQSAASASSAATSNADQAVSGPFPVVTLLGTLSRLGGLPLQIGALIALILAVAAPPWVIANRRRKAGAK